MLQLQHKSIVFGSGPWLSQPMGARTRGGVGGLACQNCAPSGITFNLGQSQPKELPCSACEYKDPVSSPLHPSQDSKQLHCRLGRGSKTDAQDVSESGNPSEFKIVNKSGSKVHRRKTQVCCAPTQCFNPLNVWEGPDPEGPDMVSQMERDLQDMECDVTRMKRELSDMQRFNEELEKESTSAMNRRLRYPDTLKCDSEEEVGKKGKDKNRKSEGKNINCRDKSAGDQNEEQMGEDNNVKLGGYWRSRSVLISKQNRSRSYSLPWSSQKNSTGAMNDTVQKNETKVSEEKTNEGNEEIEENKELLIK